MKLIAAALLLASLAFVAQSAPNFYPGFGGQQQQQQQQVGGPLGIDAGDFGGITIDTAPVTSLQQQQQQQVNGGYGVYGYPTFGNGFYNGFGNPPAIPGLGNIFG